MWKDANEYKICVRGDTVVNTIATVTKTEETNSGNSSGSSSSSSGDDDDIIIIEDDLFSNYDEYEEGLLANRPDAGYSGCRCYYATDQDKYYISTSSSGGFLTYYWMEVGMRVQSYKPTTDQSTGYYKVVSGNTTTIYQVVTYYSWVNIAEDQHPQVSAQKVSGTWGYDNFRLTNMMLDYEEKSLSSMNTGYLYGVIEDA